MEGHKVQRAEYKRPRCYAQLRPLASSPQSAHRVQKDFPRDGLHRNAHQQLHREQLLEFRCPLRASEASGPRRPGHFLHLGSSRVRQVSSRVLGACQKRAHQRQRLWLRRLPIWLETRGDPEACLENTHHRCQCPYALQTSPASNLTLREQNYKWSGLNVLPRTNSKKYTQWKFLSAKKNNYNLANPELVLSGNLIFGQNFLTPELIPIQCNPEKVNPEFGPEYILVLFLTFPIYTNAFFYTLIRTKLYAQNICQILQSTLGNHIKQYLIIKIFCINNLFLLK